MTTLSKLMRIDFSQEGNHIRDAVASLTEHVDLTTLIIYFIESYTSADFDFIKIELAIQLLYDNNNLSFKENFLAALAICEQLFEGKPAINKFVLFIKEFLKMELITHNDLAQYLELQTLDELKILPKLRTTKQFVRFNTNRLYKQTNYNLMRENIYGFTSISSFLFAAFQACLNPQYIDQRLLRLIAVEAIDHKLILDFILNCFCFELEYKYEYYLTYFKTSHWFKDISNAFDEPSARGEVLLSNIVSTKLQVATNPLLGKLYHVTALLIKEKLVRIDLVFSILYPNNQEWEGLYKKFISNIRKEKLPILNNLSTAADEIEPEEVEMENKKIHLLRALLAIGDLDTVEPILYENPEFLGYDKDCARLLCRLINYMLEPKTQFSCRAFRPDQLRLLAKPKMNLTLNKQVKSTKALSLDPRICFYYPHWNSFKLPNLKTQEHYEFLLKWLRILGHNLIDPLLYSKMAGMARDPISGGDTIHKEFYVEVLRRNLFPSLACSNGNEGLQNSLWDLMTVLPAIDRFMYYGDWFGNDWYITAELEARRFAANRRADSVVKRLTSTDSREFGLFLKRDFYCEPYTIFMRVIKEVMNFGRIPEFVDVFKFLHLLSSDIFQYFLFSVLTEPKKHGALSTSRLKDDLVNPRDWIKNLAGLIAALCRKYSQFSIAGVIHYVANQLHTGNGFDLVILTEFISTLGGICEFDNLDSNTLNGSVALRAHYFSLNLAYRATATSAGRLVDALRKHNFLYLLVVQLCKQHQDLVYLLEVDPDVDEDAITDATIPGLEAVVTKKHYQEFRFGMKKQEHLDALQSTILQLFELISNNPEDQRKRDNIPADKRLTKPPTLSEYANTYHVDLPYLFNFLRTQWSIPVYEELKAKRSALYSKVNNTDELYEENTVSKLEEELQVTSLEPIIQEIENVYDPTVTQVLKPVFLATFWQMCGGDLYVPEQEYEKVLALLKPKRDDAKKLGLESGRRDQREKVELSLLRLRYFKSDWFEPTASHTDVSKHLINHCILQRLSFSSADALYCAKLLVFLASQNIPNYSFIDLVAYFLKNACLLLYSSTRTEASNYGDFVEELLQVLNKWFASQESYLNDVVNTSPEMVTQALLAPYFSSENDLTQLFSEHPDTSSPVLNHKGFRTLYGILHEMLYEQIIKSLTKEEHFYVTSTVSFLTKIETLFPLKRSHHSGISKLIENHINNEFLVSLCTSFKIKLKINTKKFLELEPPFRFDEDVDFTYQLAEVSPPTAKQSPRASSNLISSHTSANVPRADTSRLRQALETPARSTHRDRDTTSANLDRPRESSTTDSNVLDNRKRVTPIASDSRSRPRLNELRDSPRAEDQGRISVNQVPRDATSQSNRGSRRAPAADHGRRDEAAYSSSNRNEPTGEPNYPRAERSARPNEASDSYRPGYSNQQSDTRDTRPTSSAQQFSDSRHNFDTRGNRDQRGDGRGHMATKRHQDAPSTSFVDEGHAYNDGNSPNDRRVRPRLEDSTRAAPNSHAGGNYRNPGDLRYNDNRNLQQGANPQNQRGMMQRNDQRTQGRQNQSQNFRHNNRGTSGPQGQGFNRNQRH